MNTEKPKIMEDFDVHEWAASEFLEPARNELLEERWI